jgi:hypothetical protein
MKPQSLLPKVHTATILLTLAWPAATYAQADAHGTNQAGAPTPSASPAPGAAPAPEAGKPEGGRPAMEGAEGGNPMLLPGGIRIGGMFDASYERVGMNGSPSSGQNAFRNYHHFVFLSRQGQDIPIGFNAEIINQTFYEMTMRLWRKGPFRLSAHGGKILVPFGPDPLFHKNYGGQSAIDQRLLPVVWASYGAGLRAAGVLAGISVAEDLYLVQGFDLMARDRVLDMQRDLQAYDGSRIAVGNRLSLAWGPFTLWYSAYWNTLRFGRRLLMQAVDLTLWRPSLPVLNRLAVGIGAVRAHVSKDNGRDLPDTNLETGAYYHFADYLWLRFYATSWLYLQARSGLSTFDNYNGRFYDKGRATADDGSHHNVILTAEYAGAQVSLGYYWNFEKVDETANDFFRLMVRYAF